MCWKWDILVQNAEKADDDEKSPRSIMHSLQMQKRRLAKNMISPNRSEFDINNHTTTAQHVNIAS